MQEVFISGQARPLGGHWASGTGSEMNKIEPSKSREVQTTQAWVLPAKEQRMTQSI